MALLMEEINTATVRERERDCQFLFPLSHGKPTRSKNFYICLELDYAYKICKVIISCQSMYMWLNDIKSDLYIAFVEIRHRHSLSQSEHTFFWQI